jgi:septum formation protein
MILKKQLVLASRSPRRLALLRQIGLNVEVAPCHLPEEFASAWIPEENARSLSVAKARCVAAGINDAIVLAADTIVVVDGLLLGKPENSGDAVRMLELLSGRTHTVHTGFALLDQPSGRVVDGVESTSVTFRQLPRAEILEYVAGGSPLDKAGAYGIQDDYGAVFVTRIEGCYYNVVGLPLARVYVALSHMQDSLAHHR